MNVSEYVADLALRNRISDVRTSGDDWAETVTRLAGDDVNPDKTERLLIALRRAGKVSGVDMVLLLANYFKEQRGLRSI